MPHRHYIYIIAAALALAFPAALRAYDFCAPNAQAKMLYYNIIGTGVAELTCEHEFLPTPSYTGDLEVPAVVTNTDGTTYTVASVSPRAMQYCTALESIDLPASVEYIGDFAFAGCSSLASFSVPASLVAMGTNPFDGCFALISISGTGISYATAAGSVYNSDRTACLQVPQGLEGRLQFAPNTSAIGPAAAYGCTFIDEIALPDALASIGESAFYFCGSLRQVHIPAGVTHIDRCAFGACLSLEAIDVDPANTAFTSSAGSLYTSGLHRLVQAPSGCLAEIAPGTVEIGEMASMHNAAITDIIIPDGVERIHTGAFASCPAAVTLDLPASVSEIGPMAFGLCDSLKYVYVRAADPASVTVSADAFAATRPAARTLFVPEGSAAAFRGAEVWNEFDEITEFSSLSPQSIDWFTDNDAYSADSLTIALSATASSGLDIEYVLAPESTGRAVISGNVLNVVDSEGVINVIATQHGNALFAPALPVKRSVRTAPAGIAESPIQPVKVYSRGGRIIIECADRQAVAVITDINGITVYTGTRRSIALPPHAIYIVSIAGHSQKVVLQ